MQELEDPNFRIYNILEVKLLQKHTEDFSEPL